MKKWFLIAPLMALSLASLWSCGGKVVDPNDPESLYKEAEEEVETDHYQLALDKFRAVKNKFPYSQWAVSAQIRIADVYYLQESFGEAALAYEAFKDLHPKHEKVAYAMFRLAKSHEGDMPGNVARDLTPGYRALDAYNDFLRRFPNAPEAKEGREAVTRIRSSLAAKELYIGNFYYGQSEYDSARGRYKKLLELYPDSPHVTEAKEKLARIDERLKKK
jgi:outer membrane protein assembly factor BamD